MTTNCATGPTGLVSRWRAEGNAVDDVGGRNGTLEGAVTFAPGKVGQAFSFDGASLVSVPDDPIWTLGTSPFTIGLWVKFNQIQGRDAFIGHDEGGGSTNKWIFWFDIQGHTTPPGNALRFHVNSPTIGPIDPVAGTWTPIPGQWYHVAVTRSGSTYTLYVDGSAIATANDPNAIPDPAYALTIGAAEGFRFNGLIDEVGIYNRALSSSEIQALAGPCSEEQASTAIASNFNSTSIQAGTAIWFNSIVKVGGLPDGGTLNFTGSTVRFAANGTSYSLPVPNASVTVASTVSQATTVFDAAANTWRTTVPVSYTGNVFLTGLAYTAPVNLPGGINPVTWSGNFSSPTAGVTASWKWAAAVYTQFGSSYDVDGVKPIDGNKLNPYVNSDHAGTPESFKAYVTGGARGGGGSNWTGGYSGTAAAPVALVAPEPRALILAAMNAGRGHACGVTASGEAYCWGANDQGQLGDGTTTSTQTAVRVATSLRFTQIDGGQWHTCGLTSSGTVYCWGFNAAGQLGNGTTVSSATPVQVPGGPYSAVRPGNEFTCALTTTGMVDCWGGYSTTAPTRVAGGPFSSLANAGGEFICALTPTQAAYCWGPNYYGQLGIGARSGGSETPVAVIGGLAFSSITTGYGHACAITTAGETYCWGWNAAGQLGDGTTTDRYAPVRVVGGPFAQVSGGGDHTCALTSSGTAYCWGWNSLGQLGAGITDQSRVTPVAVASQSVFSTIANGASFGCALEAGTGVTYCWGENYGSSPVKVTY